MSVIILDNGAGKIKFGTEATVRPQGSMTNCTAVVNKQMQVLIGDQIDATLNGSNLNFTRPFDRGYLVNRSSQLDVWSRIFSFVFERNTF